VAVEPVSLFFRQPAALEVRAAEDQAMFQALRNARMGSSAGGTVSTDQALQSPTVAACVHTVASSISSLELAGYRSANENGLPEPLSRLPRLWREPSAEESPEDWFYKVIQAAMCDGRAWGRIVARDPRMSATQIELVPDEAVTVKPDRQTGAWTFAIDRTPVDPMDMWWMTGVPARHHPFGVSLVQRASEPIGVQLAALHYLRTWFRDGAHPTALIQTETDLGPEQATGLKRRIMDLTSGSREPLLLPKSVTLNPFQTTPADSEIGDVLMTTATQIATFFLFPPEQVGGSTGSSMTYSNVEQQQISLMQRAVRYWMRKLELSLSRAVRPEAIYAKFDENDMVRTDLKTKFDAIIAATGGPFLTPNEGREMDDRAPVDAGDALRGPAPATVGGVA
jgi:HK97 family phage portal protein